MRSRIVEGEVEKPVVGLTEMPKAGRTEQRSDLAEKRIWKLEQPWWCVRHIGVMC